MLRIHSCQIIHAVYIGYYLGKRKCLGMLFETAVEVSQMRLHGPYFFAIEQNLQSQNTMGGGMLGSEIHYRLTGLQFARPPSTRLRTGHIAGVVFVLNPPHKPVGESIREKIPVLLYAHS
jgi:hypothetical protein